jgi:mono/diheme cytochrome c family protein
MNLKLTILSGVFAGLALAWAVAALIARDYSERNKEIFTEMAYSVAAESQGRSEVLPGGLVEQAPPEGTLYRGQQRYFAPPVPLEKLGAEDAGKVKNNINPYANLTGDTRAQVLLGGEKLYVKSCESCHGAKGAGTGEVVRFGIGATNLQTNLVKYTDGELFHIITCGVRTMPAHDGHVRFDDRWKLVVYLRNLQGGRP